VVSFLLPSNLVRDTVAGAAVDPLIVTANAVTILIIFSFIVRWMTVVVVGVG